MAAVASSQKADNWVAQRLTGKTSAQATRSVGYAV